MSVQCLKCDSDFEGDINDTLLKCPICDVYYHKYLAILNKKATKADLSLETFF